MGDNQKRAVIITVFISCVILVALLVSRQFINTQKKSSNTGANLKSSLSFASLDGLSIEENDEDSISFRIQAEKANVKNRKFGFLRVAVQKVLELENVTVRISEPGNDTESVKIISEQATMYLDSKNILFTGNVVCASGSGDILKSVKHRFLLLHVFLKKINSF